MKKYSLLIILTICATFLICSNLSAQNLMYGCVKKNQGQLRIVNNPSDCNPSEYFISWGARPYDRVDPLNLYVDAAIGIDDPNRGLTQDKPFRTIGYALERVPILRTLETSTTINVAAGQYRESITIGMNSIWLKGAGPNNTALIGDGSTAVVQLYGPLKGGVAGFTIKNGGSGIYSSSATVTIENCIIADNRGYAGVEVYNNSFMNLKNSDVKGNNTGISLSRNSSIVMDTCNISANYSNGLAAWYTSTARLKNCDVSFNRGNGIEAGAGSSLRMSLSKVYNNTLSGLGITQQATLASRGGNEIYSNGDASGWRAGIAAYYGSVVVFTLEDTQVKDSIYHNNGPGLYISNNSSLFMKYGEIKENRFDGVGLYVGSTGHFEGGASVTSNGGYGVGCYKESVVVGSSDFVPGPTNCMW